MSQENMEPRASRWSTDVSPVTGGVLGTALGGCARPVLGLESAAVCRRV
jgi:hypothetical protein